MTTVEGIRITYVDRKDQLFIALGGAAWETAEEAEAEWAKLGHLQTSGKTSFLADRMTVEGMTDHYYLTGRIVERLLGEPLHMLIAKGRKNYARQQKELKRLIAGKRNTHLASTLS